MEERLIVSLTTYSKRISNIPAVLDTIFSQTLKPDLVVLNLAFEEIIPEDVQNYIKSHNIEVNRVPDTKVYKKLIPTLKRHPNDCIITIDDDFLYPSVMVEEFVSIHKIWPDHPISGNKEVHFGMQCHCGCASLSKACYYGKFLDCIDDEVIQNCPSDDLVYTYFANKNGHPYINTKSLYFQNMPSYNEGEGYTLLTVCENGIVDTYNYLSARYGTIGDNIDAYLKSLNNENQIDILIGVLRLLFEKKGFEKGREFVYSTNSFKLGNYIIKRINKLSKIMQNILCFSYKNRCKVK